MVMEIVLGGQQVAAFPEVFGIVHRGLEVAARLLGPLPSERGLPEPEVRAYVLARDQSFATLPGMKAARINVRQRRLVPADIVVQRDELGS